MPQDGMPWSKEIELAILCFCAIAESQDGIREICSTVKPEHFYSEHHKVIFSAILDMVAAGGSVEMPKIWEHLMAEGNIDRAGGHAFISSLTSFEHKSCDYQGDCAILKKYAMLRGIIKAGMAMVQRASLGTDDPADIADGTIAFLRQLESELSSHAAETPELENSVSLCASLEAKSKLVCVSGINSLDDQLGGFRAGELIIVAAETGVGKTMMARQIRRESCKIGLHGLYCSGEMDGEQLSAREGSARTGIPLWKFRKPWAMEREEFNKVLGFASGECDKCCVLSGNLSVSRILATAEHARRNSRLGFMMVDYDELVEAPGKTDFEKQAAVARACKAISMQHGIPVFLLSQLRKLQAGERSEKPNRHRLYGASAKANEASTILFIDRPYVRELTGDETEATIYIIKNRNGNVGQVKCRFNVARMRFTGEIEVSVP